MLPAPLTLATRTPQPKAVYCALGAVTLSSSFALKAFVSDARVQTPAGLHALAPAMAMRAPFGRLMLKLLDELGLTMVRDPFAAFSVPVVARSDWRRIAPPQSPPIMGVGNVFGQTLSRSPVFDSTRRTSPRGSVITTGF